MAYYTISNSTSSTTTNYYTYSYGGNTYVNFGNAYSPPAPKNNKEAKHLLKQEKGD
jgi:hypothetical protein